jgi:cytochrome c oxidase assembly factor CtaG
MPSAGDSAGVADTAGTAGIIAARRMRMVATVTVLTWVAAPAALVLTRAVGQVADAQAHIRVHMAADVVVAVAADTVIAASPTQVSSQRHEEPGSFRASCLLNRRFTTLAAASDRRGNTAAEMSR